jgi:hypothetical protein
MTPGTSNGRYYYLCVKNDDYPASLETRKVYEAIPDAEAQSHGMLRVIDESGDDYLYPAEMFIAIELPEPAIFALQSAS